MPLFVTTTKPHLVNDDGKQDGTSEYFTRKQLAENGYPLVFNTKYKCIYAYNSNLQQPISFDGTNTHYTTHMYIGAQDNNLNANVSNPYLKLFDNTERRDQFQIKGNAATTVNSDLSGNITISSPHITLNCKESKNEEPARGTSFVALKSIEINETNKHQIDYITETVKLPETQSVAVTAPNAPSATEKKHGSDQTFSFVTGISAYGDHGITYTMEKIYIKSDNTDTKVTSAANHYDPTKEEINTLTTLASGATADWSIDVVTGVTIKRDPKGHVTDFSIASGKIPADPNTDTKVTSVDNHYIPSNGTVTTLTNGSNVGWSGSVITGITRDAAGHITSVTKGNIPADPNSTDIQYGEYDEGTKTFTNHTAETNNTGVGFRGIPTIKGTANNNHLRLKGDGNTGVGLFCDTIGPFIQISTNNDHRAQHEFSTRNHDTLPNTAVVVLSNCGPLMEGLGGTANVNSFSIQGAGAITVSQNNRVVTLTGSHGADHAFSYVISNSNNLDTATISLSNIGANGSGSTSFKLCSNPNNGISLNQTANGIEICTTLEPGENISMESSNGMLRIDSTDTLNTAGSTNDVGFLYLVGAKSQSNSTRTYSNGNCYINGSKLYSNGLPTVTSYGNGVTVGGTSGTTYGPVAKIQTVSALPASPQSDTLYLVIGS